MIYTFSLCLKTKWNLEINKKQNKEMRKIFKSLLILFLVAFVSCESIDPIYYDSVARIYFEDEQTDYSFGDKPLSIEETIVEIKVRIMGESTTATRRFKVEVDEEETTAIEGVQYEALPSDFEVLQDSIYGYIPVKLLRSGIDGTVEESLMITLHLIDGGDFVTGVKESLSTKLKFNNYLEEPSWWSWIGYYVGDYAPEKYQKYIEIHGSPIDESYLGNNFLSVVSEFYQVKLFFDANPDLGVHFPEDTEWL